MLQSHQEGLLVIKPLSRISDSAGWGETQESENFPGGSAAPGSEATPGEPLLSQQLTCIRGKSRRVHSPLKKVRIVAGIT